MWETLELDKEIHIIPIGDIHQHEENSKCWCNPSIETEINKDIITHNSLDKRELYETGQRKPN
ncbi:hypothetical protein EKK58_12835 [Candidatus Dependentiae bacterium]|nr:MAG: hypothetical protein EKK58_12835 [Candidatus Dependentiae bacterium]